MSAKHFLLDKSDRQGVHPRRMATKRPRGRPRLTHTSPTRPFGMRHLKLDTYRRLRVLAAEQGRTLGAVVQDVLDKGLESFNDG